MRILENIVLRRADRVIFIDERARETYINMMPWLEAKSMIIPTAVDTSSFFPRGRAEREALRRRLGLPLEEPVFIYVGRISREKNVSGLVAEFGKYAAAEKKGILLIMGEGPEINNIRNSVNERELNEKVRILSRLTRQEISDYLALSDLFLSESSLEGLSIACLEALACGVPVVATDVGDLNKIIINGQTGELVTSPSELKQAMMRAVGSTEKFGWASDRISEECRKKAMEYSWDVIARKVIRQYELALEADV